MTEYEERYKGNGDGYANNNDDEAASPPLHQRSSGFDDTSDSRSQVQFSVNLYNFLCFPLKLKKDLKNLLIQWESRVWCSLVSIGIRRQ